MLAREKQPGVSSYGIWMTAVAALGGLLFGFDIAIINGALVFLKQQLGLDEVQTEMAASALLAGCIFGAALAGPLSDRYGRRQMLLAAATLFGLSAVAAAVPRTLGEFLAARWLGGLGIGVASVLSPLYIAEISPAQVRGRLVSLNQLAIVTGILLAYLTSWLLSALGPSSWRWMFASAAVPSVGFLLALLGVPESPRWLVKDGRSSQALSVLARIQGAVEAAMPELREIEQAVAEETGSVWELLGPRLRRPLFIALGLAILQQVTGVNTILFYGSLIFTEQVRGHTASSALLANVIIGAINFLFTLVALAVIDRLGRRAVLMLAASGMALSLVLLGGCFRWQPEAGRWILALVLLYVACFAVGMGPGVWVVISELFPTRIRGRAMAIATVALWSASTLLTMTFLSLVSALSASGAFWLYGAICGFTVWFVHRWVPETKGRTLEEIERVWLHGKV